MRQLQQIQPFALVQWFLFAGVALFTAQVGILPRFAFSSPVFGDLEFRMYWTHALMIPLIVVTIVRLLFNDDYARHFARTLKSIVTGPGVLWLALAAWVFASQFWAFQNPSNAVYASLLLALELSLGIVIATTISRGALAMTSVVFLVAALPHAILGLLQTVQGDVLGLYALGERPFNPEDPFGFGPQLFRPYGLSFHPNILAGHLGMTVLIGLIAAYGTRKRPVLMGVMLLLVAVCFVALLATVSRVALVITVVVMVPAALYAFRPRGRGLIAVWALVGLTGIALVIIGITTPLVSQLVNRFYTMLGDPQAAMARIAEGVPNTLGVWELSPVAGVGAYNLTETMVRTQPLDRHGMYLHAHNVYIVVLAELGIVGFVLYTAGLWIPVRNLLAKDRMLSLAAAALLTFNLIILFDYYYWWPPPMRPTMFWVLGTIWGLRAWNRAAQPVT
ncbi:MAG: O-antigen ligase family protein, partial [Chloroflexota bacterium]